MGSSRAQDLGRDQDHHLLHVRLPLRHQGASEGRHGRYIEGNPDHPVNKGVICAKGAAGIMQHYSPARLTKPLLRVGERGSGEFREIEWEEALRTATLWLSEVRNTDPKKLAFFTGRDQSQGLTGWWAAQFGTPNYAAHGGFCSVNMAAAGLYTFGGSFWEFGEPDWEAHQVFPAVRRRRRPRFQSDQDRRWAS
jgi:anaerobic selenocysteine-containing dehydrogenase